MTYNTAYIILECDSGVQIHQKPETAPPKHCTSPPLHIAPFSPNLINFQHPSTIFGRGKNKIHWAEVDHSLLSSQNAFNVSNNKKNEWNRFSTDKLICNKLDAKGNHFECDREG